MRQSLEPGDGSKWELGHHPALGRGGIQVDQGRHGQLRGAGHVEGPGPEVIVVLQRDPQAELQALLDALEPVA